MKLLAFAASNSRNSINRKLIGHAVDVLTIMAPDTEVEHLDLLDYEMPIYSIDRENESGIPEPAQRFYDKIGAADAVLISFAEHNGSYTVAYKNVYDWASRIDSKVYQGKPVVLLATSPGGRGGAGVLGAANMAFPHFGADVRASLPVPKFYDIFDQDTGALTDDDLARQLKEALTKLL
ncbi:MAG: NAD(P)H-dependent oxidoreductase [Pseudomonadota bacterium]